VLAGYTILRVLGQGGSSVVYLARQEALDREVAIKVLRRDVDEPKVWERFLREARIVARLSGHANVITVYTAERSPAGKPYLVTEYLDGGSLGDLIAARGPQPVAAVTRVGVAIADALGAAHRVGILHRDVKPGNVLLGLDGRVKLGDFGIARLLAAQSVTPTDVIAFTPEHVAPEILRGHTDGPWSDLYGLASTLTTALVGTPPFRRRPDERMESLLSRKLMAGPPGLPEWVPIRLAEVLTRGLDPQPSRRPSLADFRRQLAGAGGAPPAPVPTQGFPAPAVGATRHVTTEPSDVVANMAPAPLVGPLRRPHRQLAIPALFVALLGATVAGVLVVRDHDDGGRASTTTSATLVPTSQIATATAPAPVAPAPSAQVAPTTLTGEQHVVTAEQAATFIRSYYDDVAAGNYQASWASLSPEFQRGMARSYDYYVGFWNDNDIEVGEVQLLEADQDQAVVLVELRWNGNSTGETDQFTLRENEAGELLIASQRTLD
jgi:tRNA A-37 threonylcarbamoyl transferase component Bud32